MKGPHSATHFATCIRPGKFIAMRPSEVAQSLALFETLRLFLKYARARRQWVFNEEEFNLFNTPTFALFTDDDWGYIGVPDPNAVTGTFTHNREFQLSLKLTF